jgi:hypothetical protein
LASERGLMNDMNRVFGVVPAIDLGNGLTSCLSGGGVA